MRILNETEVKSVSGGFFGLFSWIFGGWGHRRNNYGYGHGHDRGYGRKH